MGNRAIHPHPDKMLRFALATSLLSLLALPLPAAAAGNAARGATIAQRNCAACHAVGPRGASPNPKSPPFRTLSQRYPLKDLEEAMAEGIMVGHEGPEMPVFEFRTSQIADLMAYLARIQVKKR
jgi:mono/diheme cytochrome c family protein